MSSGTDDRDYMSQEDHRKLAQNKEGWTLDTERLRRIASNPKVIAEGNASWEMIEAILLADAAQQEAAPNGGPRKSNLEQAVVWHQGTKSFYDAMLLGKLKPPTAPFDFTLPVTMELLNKKEG